MIDAFFECIRKKSAVVTALCIQLNRGAGGGYTLCHGLETIYLNISVGIKRHIAPYAHCHESVYPVPAIGTLHSACVKSVYRENSPTLAGRNFFLLCHRRQKDQSHGVGAFFCVFGYVKRICNVHIVARCDFFFINIYNAICIESLKLYFEFIVVVGYVKIAAVLPGIILYPRYAVCIFVPKHIADDAALAKCCVHRARNGCGNGDFVSVFSVSQKCPFAV